MSRARPPRIAPALPEQARSALLGTLDLAERPDEQQLIELLLVVGLFSALSTVANALAVDPEPGPALLPNEPGGLPAAHSIPAFKETGP